MINSASTYMGKLSTLLAWHRADRVDAREELRNDEVYGLYQTNRNPFVDHPEWVDLTFAPAHTDRPVLNIALTPSGIVLMWLAALVLVAGRLSRPYGTNSLLWRIPTLKVLGYCQLPLRGKDDGVMQEPENSRSRLFNARGGDGLARARSLSPAGLARAARRQSLAPPRRRLKSPTWETGYGL